MDSGHGDETETSQTLDYVARIPTPPSSGVDASNAVRDLGGGLSGLMSELDAMSAAAEVAALELPGTGRAEITLDSTVFREAGSNATVAGRLDATCTR